MNDFRIFTDGSYRSSKDQGGIGVLWLKDGKEVQRFSKGFKHTTNNQMELLAIKAALVSIKKPIESLEIVSDSEYSIGVLTKNWKPKKNIELINSIKKLLKEKQELVNTPILFVHTRGHQTDDSEFTKYNNICDELAQTISNSIL